MKIDGPNVPMTGDKYNIRNCPYPVSWSTSDPSVATINASTGEISISGHGYITINATYKSVSGQSFSKSKKIMAGVPEFYLDFRYDQGKGYITTARCREREFYYFLNSGDINYEWGLKSGESDIVWISSKDSVFVLPAPADVEPKTIFMRLRSIGGYKSKTYNYTAEIQYPYQYIPNYIVTNSKGEVYSCDNISVSHYYNYSPNQDYTVGMRFPMFEREELLALLQMMKPWGETEMMKFVVNTQSSMRRDLQTAPVFIIYFENFPDEYFSGEISFDDWIPGFK